MAVLQTTRGGETEHTVKSAEWERATNRHVTIQTIVISIVIDGIAHGKYQIHVANKESVIHISDLSGSIGATKNPQIAILV